MHEGDERIPADECLKKYLDSGCNPGAITPEQMLQNFERQGGMTRNELESLITLHLPLWKLRERGVRIPR